MFDIINPMRILCILSMYIIKNIFTFNYKDAIKKHIFTIFNNIFSPFIYKIYHFPTYILTTLVKYANFYIFCLLHRGMYCT